MLSGVPEWRIDEKVSVAQKFQACDKKPKKIAFALKVAPNPCSRLAALARPTKDDLRTFLTADIPTQEQLIQALL